MRNIKWNKSAFSVEALSTSMCFAFCITVLVGYFNFNQLKGYMYFVYLYPWLFVCLLIVSVISLTLLTVETTKALAYRIFNLRLVSLFWLVVSLSFTIDSLNTATMTYFILSLFSLVKSLELSEQLDIQRIEDGKNG